MEIINMDIIEEIKKFVENECKKPTSKYGYEPFTHHFIKVVEYAKNLSDKLGGDEEVIQIAAWLHDIGSIINGRENHHVTGAEIAGKKLKELNYLPKKIELVKRCILNHRGSQDNIRESIEEKIVTEADVMSNFDNISGIFQCAFVYENKNREEAEKSVREKLERKWNQLYFEESKKFIKPKYEAAKLLLK